MGDGEMPMHLAARDGHVEVIQSLEEAGADVSVANADGRTPLAWNGHADATKAMKEAGASISAAMTDGQTPMHLAAHNGHVEALKEAGADFSFATRNGWTPMHDSTGRQIYIGNVCSLLTVLNNNLLACIYASWQDLKDLFGACGTAPFMINLII